MTDKEAIEALTDKDVVNPYLTLEALGIAIDALKERAERKTGKWRDKSAGDYRCTNCGNIIELGDEIIMSVKRFKYCPSCGAKMEVDDADRD